jgi:hypothetical protein
MITKELTQSVSSFPILKYQIQLKVFWHNAWVFLIFRFGSAWEYDLIIK